MFLFYWLFPSYLKRPLKPFPVGVTVIPPGGVTVAATFFTVTIWLSPFYGATFLPILILINEYYILNISSRLRPKRQTHRKMAT